jgi:hypothetical protein
MQSRLRLWGGFAALFVAFWLLIVVWAIREGGTKDKKDNSFDKSMFEKFHGGFPEPGPDEP